MIVSNRRIDAPDYRASDRKSVLLPKQSLVHAFVLALAATFGVTGGTGAGTVASDAVFRWFSLIQIQGDGGTLQAWRGRTFGVYTKLLAQQQEYQDPPSDDTAALSEAVEANVYIPAYPLRTNGESVFLLPLYAIASPTLVVDYAAAADAVDGADGAIALTNETVTLWEHPVLNLPKSPASQLYGLTLRNFGEKPIVAAETSHKFYLDWLQPGEELVRIIIEAEDVGAGAGDIYMPSDALVQEFRVNINGADVWERTTWNTQRNRNYRMYQLAARESGAVIVDFAEDQSVAPGDLPRIMSGPRPYVEFSLAAPVGTGQLRISTESIRRPRAAA